MSNKEKTKSIIEEIGDIVVLIWNKLVWLVSAVAGWIATWRWKKITTIVGIVITVIASIILIFKIVVGLLLLGDPEQAGAIINAIVGIDIFSYISFWDYFGLVVGGLLWDLALWTLVLWLGIYWGWGRNLFIKPKCAWFYVACIAVLGFSLMLGSIFYMAPELIEIQQQLHQKHKHYHLNKQNKEGRYYYPSKNEYYRAMDEFEARQRIIQDQFNNFWR